MNSTMTTNERKALLTACFIGFAYSANYTNHAPLKDMLVAAFETSTFEFTKAKFGLLTTAIFLTHALMQIPGGHLADHFGPKKILIAALSVVVIGNFGISTSTTYMALITWKFLIGFGTGTCFISGARYIYQNSKPERVLLNQGYYGACILMGSGFVIFAVPLIAKHFNAWNYGFLATAIVALLGLIAALFAPQAEAKEHPQTSLKALLSHGPLYALGWVQMASFGLVIVIGSWITTLLTEKSGIESKWLIHAVASLVLLIGIFSRSYGGNLVQRHGVKKVLVGSIFMNATGCMLLAFLPEVFPVVLLAIVLLGLGCGFPYSALFSRATSLFPGRAGAAMGLVNMMGIVFILCGAPLVGQLTDLSGNFTTAFLSLGLFALSSLFAIVKIPATNQH
ncbi:MAG: hypothetical protein CFE24_06470 [Flavobacterium sp. BFFFF2]|nr:MAG: hypothetical protein CFE24_06470 [Flavobacterium sp. BFFFF2]